MNPQEDPLGQALLAYLAGDPGASVMVFSDVTVPDKLEAAYLFRSYLHMSGWEQQALAACRGPVLDIGAGAGAHSLALQESGISVTALDSSPGAVEVMRRRGVADVRLGAYQHFEGSGYQTLLLMMNGIGVTGNLLGLNAFLQVAHQWLAPGGQILLDSSDIRYLYEHEQGFSPPGDRPYYGIVRYRMVYGSTSGPAFEWLYIDQARLRRHAQLAGWQMDILAEGPHYEYLARLSRA
ncbi:MAG: class I SAM-dependent methyltransferase [Bacteroidia bacterium]|nr:class I SAM-dependent methyltransferase [Bacteroidia bacterium]